MCHTIDLMPKRSRGGGTRTAACPAWPNMVGMRRSSGGQKKPTNVPDTSARAEAASALAIAALRFITEEPERLRVFLSLSGIDPQAVRAAAREPGFLLGVLDHLAGDESLLLAFARESEIDPEDVRVARRVLAGGEEEPY